MPPAQPQWQVLNEGSLASVRVRLPPRSVIHCESDAVVTLSSGVTVRGIVSGGLWAGLARAFLTRESFFTTVVENTSLEAVGDVLLAPSDPGGIALHRFSAAAGDGDMLLCSGAYLAADEGVVVESVLQEQFKNSIFSGTGFFLLKASSSSPDDGNCTLAMSAYGSMHKYELRPGEKRIVDNGHLVAWTASMNYAMKLASARAGIVGSLTSGEGLHCEFEGPGTIYIQSHKVPSLGSEGRQRPTRSGGGGPVAACVGLLVFVFFVVIVLVFFAAILSGSLDFKSSYPARSPTNRYREYSTYGGQQHHHHPQHYGYNERVRGEL